MFQKGDLIVYGNNGVCRVEDIGRPQGVRGTDKDRLYYTLAPMYHAEVIYVPVDTPVFMRHVLSREAAEELILKIPSIRADPYDCRDQRMLSDHYRASLETHCCEDLVQLIKAVYVKSKNSLKNGKKPGQVDERYRKRAEELLQGEFAAALGIPREEVVPYITQRVSAEES